MDKNFDEWNEQKKKIDLGRSPDFYKERDIWWCCLGVNVGSEENGSGNKFQRPVLVLKRFSINNCLVIPLTTSLSESDFRLKTDGIGKRAAIISQIRVVDTKRFSNRITRIPKEDFEYIRKSIKDLL